MMLTDDTKGAYETLLTVIAPKQNTPPADQIRNIENTVITRDPGPIFIPVPVQVPVTRSTTAPAPPPPALAAPQTLAQDNHHPRLQHHHQHHHRQMNVLAGVESKRRLS